jgi:1,2-diacylglycerol 3-alpha-glucosyltransferase
MKVVHACLSCFYIDGFSYQENELARVHVEAGHDVLIVASTETLDTVGNLGYTKPTSYVGAEKARVIRLPYTRWMPHRISKKVRSYPGLRKLLEDENPDVIFFHGFSGWALLPVAAYVRRHPEVVFNVDSHEDLANSARSRASRFVHEQFYGRIARRVRDVAAPILCVTTTTIDFVENLYGYARKDLEFFPLGGHIQSPEEHAARRSAARDEYGILADQVLLLQTGKMGAEKRLVESLEAFAKIDGPHMRLILAGSIHPAIAQRANQLIAADNRVTFVGWKGVEGLGDLLSAADVYVQPGSQSSTMQLSLCAGCAVILNRVSSHVPYVNGNGWLVSGNEELLAAFQDIADSSVSRTKVRCEQSLALASRLLDYKMLGARALIR